jgi:hypothetical protein
MKGVKPDFTAYQFNYNKTDHTTVGANILGYLPANFVVVDASVYAETALTSGGTITLGDGVDADGYSTDVVAASISAGAAIKCKGALVFDHTDDINLHYAIASTTTAVVATIGTSAPSTGVLWITFLGYHV